MIIYYHCTSDNPLLLSFLLTCHPYIHPLSFHEMIFILVPPVFASASTSLVMRMCNKKLPRLQDVHADEQWRLILTSVEVSLELLLILIIEKHKGSLSEKAHRRPQQNRFM